MSGRRSAGDNDRTDDPHLHHGHRHDHAHGHGNHDGRGGLTRRLAAVVRPHSHDVADQLDDVLESSAQGIRATKLSLLLLGATAAVQLVIALISGSVALLADTVHNVADAMTSVPLWIAFVVGRRSASRAFTYGYRRAEDLAGIFIVAMIGLSAVFIGWESVGRLIAPEPMDHVGWVLVAGVVGVVGNELAAVYRIRVGRRIGSVALVADGYHARTDTIASFAVIVAALATWIGVPILDPIVGLLIAVMILWLMKQTAGQVMRRLMDGVDPAVVDEIGRVAVAVDGVVAVDTVRARWSGHRLLADLTVQVDARHTVAEGHDIGEEVRHRLLHEVAHLHDAWVHVNPAGQDGHDPHARTRHHHPGG